MTPRLIALIYFAASHCRRHGEAASALCRSSSTCPCHAACLVKTNVIHSRCFSLFILAASRYSFSLLLHTNQLAASPYSSSRCCSFSSFINPLLSFSFANFHVTKRLAPGTPNHWFRRSRRVALP
jgi:hypothetical protein